MRLLLLVKRVDRLLVSLHSGEGWNHPWDERLPIDALEAVKFLRGNCGQLQRG